MWKKQLAACIIICLTQSVLPVSAADSGHVLVVAHRGAAGYAPENTLSAFEVALTMGADYIELDVQMSKDGRLMVFHDKRVNRTTNGIGRLHALTFRQLRALDAGSWFSTEFSGERVPTLDEVLNRFWGRIGILIDIKFPELNPGVLHKVANELHRRILNEPVNGQVIVQSDDASAMRRFHRLAPMVPLGILVYRKSQLKEKELLQYTDFADYVNPDKSLVSGELAERVHELGMQMMPWTVTELTDVTPILENGADGLITDFPDYVP